LRLAEKQREEAAGASDDAARSDGPAESNDDGGNVRIVQERMSDIHHRVEEIAWTTEELSAMMEQTTTLATEIAGDSLAMAETIQDVAGQAEKGTAMAGTIKSGAGLLGRLDQVVAAASDSGEGVAQIARQMTDISDTIRETVGELGEAVQK
jgi:methyl-accepting chemotaxis protein